MLQGTSQAPGNSQQPDLFHRNFVLTAAAHELKTPLAVVAGYTDFLLAEHPGPLTEQQKSVLMQMQQSTSRMQKFIHDFLSFTALESGRFQITRQAGNVNECIAEAIAHWDAPFAERRTTCEFYPDLSLRPISFDSLKLQHIISNLLENALKFTFPGGKVTVSTQRYVWERRSVRQNAVFHHERRSSCGPARYNCVRIDVVDNGPGIPAEYHQEIFEEFLRVHQNAATQGMGLGLAIARRLTEAHGGKIWVESKVGHGSRFSVLLPFVFGGEE